MYFTGDLDHHVSFNKVIQVLISGLFSDLHPDIFYLFATNFGGFFFWPSQKTEGQFMCLSWYSTSLSHFLNAEQAKVALPRKKTHWCTIVRTLIM